jgi:predicted transcriptional regulator
MTKLLDKAIAAARGLTPEAQDQIAEVILAMAADDEDEGEEIDPADLEAIDRGLDDMKNGRFATDEEVEAAFRAFRK